MLAISTVFTHRNARTHIRTYSDVNDNAVLPSPFLSFLPLLALPSRAPRLFQKPKTLTPKQRELQEARQKKQEERDRAKKAKEEEKERIRLEKQKEKDEKIRK